MLLCARSTCVGSSSRLERRRWTRSCGPGRRIGCACRSDSCRVPQTTKLQPPLTLHRTVQTPDQFTSRSVRSKPNLSRGRGEAPATLFSLPTCPPLSSRHTKRHALLQCAKGMRRQSTPFPLSSLLSLPRRAYGRLPTVRSASLSSRMPVCPVCGKPWMVSSSVVSCQRI